MDVCCLPLLIESERMGVEDTANVPKVMDKHAATSSVASSTLEDKE